MVSGGSPEARRLIVYARCDGTHQVGCLNLATFLGPSHLGDGDTRRATLTTRNIVPDE